MSWNVYVERIMTTQAVYGALYGRQGGLWAECQGNPPFKCSQEDATLLNNAISDPATKAYAHQNGLVLNGVKFTVNLIDDDLIILKGKGDDKQKEQALVAATSNQALLIAYSNTNNVSSRQLRTQLEADRDHLKGSGY